MFPNRVSMERDDALSPEPMTYAFIYIRQSPQLRNPPMKWGKTYDNHPLSPTWAEGLRAVGCGLVSQWDH
jgi:hypothetical protein